MPKLAETITSKIHENTEIELRQSLKNKFYEIRKEFTDGRCKSIKVRGGYIEGDNNMEKEYVVDAHEALSAIENLSFEMQIEGAKTKAVEEFIQKVERVAKDVENLYQKIPE